MTIERLSAAVRGILVPLIAVSMPLLGQRDQVRVPDRATCERCTIVTSLRVTLSQAGSAPQIYNHPYSVVVDSRGYIIVARGPDGPPLAYDSLGWFVRVIGGVGDGPGEFRSAGTLLIGEGDTLYVVDSRTARISVFTPAWRFVRSAPVPHAAATAALTDGGLVVQAEVHDAARFGDPFHTFDRVGNYRRSFGGDGRPVIPGRTPPSTRWLAPARGDGFWSAAVLGEYVVERWTADGIQLHSLLREPVWFPRAPPPYGLTPDRSPSPQVLSLVEDGAGRVWTLLRVADQRWRSAVTWNRNRGGEAAMVPIIEDRDRAFDTVVEVIDPRNGSLIASHRFDQAWGRFVGPGRIYRFSVNDAGESVVELHTISLVQPAG